MRARFELWRCFQRRHGSGLTFNSSYTWASALTDTNRAWVAALPRGPIDVDDLVEICHGSPFDEDVYIFDELDVRQAFTVTRRPLCLFGHTHVPAAFCMAASTLTACGPPRGTTFEITLEADARYLVNCGAGELLAQRKAAVELYFKTTEGPNPAAAHPAAPQMARLPKTESGEVTVETTETVDPLGGLLGPSPRND